MPPPLSVLSLEGEDRSRNRSMRKLANTLDMEMMKWEWVMCGRRGEGRTGGMGSEVCMDKCMCKSQTVGLPSLTRISKMKAKWRMGNFGNCLLPHFQSWKKACQRVFTTSASCWTAYCDIDVNWRGVSLAVQTYCMILVDSLRHSTSTGTITTGKQCVLT